MVRVLCQDLECINGVLGLGRAYFTSLGDEPKSGRPKTSTNEENTTRVDELIRCDWRMKIREIALKLEIPKSTVHEIVHDTNTDFKHEQEPVQFDVVCFEMASEVGGTWLYTDRTGKDELGRPIFSSMYKNLV
ncbi:flavin-containing monooxygenase [Plakobranchus ocellatus]|uniref:Flavin-containing monooxygenase n=1 Tax=Plakobranchus ocellatus TaxID=259542 RepID=A0AAV3Z386_9GAST|nr:flavin-containing monooxygenase [Plakobranchus ocellatus]